MEYSVRKSRYSGKDGSLVMEHLTPPDSRGLNSSSSILVFQLPPGTVIPSSLSLYDAKFYLLAH